MRCVAVLAGACLALAGAAPAWAGVDLRTVAPGGQLLNDQAALAAAGDVNGDGVPDLAAGPEFGRPPAGDVYTIAFGPRLPPTTGLRVTHAEAPMAPDGGSIGGGAAAVGDWNGDGLADVAFGAIGTAPHGRPAAGTVYVILGRRTPGDVDVRTDPGVIRIDGPAHGQIGDGIAGVGDVDGDGHPDLAIPLPAGRAVIVRGGLPGGTTLDLAHPPAGATIALHGLLPGPVPHGYPGAQTRFAAAGDLDGDGRGELLAGLSGSLWAPGRVLVLRGVPGGATIDAGDPRARLARVVEDTGAIGFGSALATVPDTDGDGHPEWLIGAALPGGFVQIGGDDAGAVDVVFSRARGEIRPGRPGQPVVTVRAPGDRAGETLAGLPDVTGDGVPDLLVGEPDAAPSCRGGAGAVALVAGRATPGPARVGPRIDGSRPGAGLGSTLAVAGDTATAGERPFENAAYLDLWRLPLSVLRTPSPALPAPDRCLKVTLAHRSRAQLVRTGRLPVRIHSDAGDGRAHRVGLVVYVLGRKFVRWPHAALRFPHAGTQRLTLRLPRRVRRALSGGKLAGLDVTAQQRVGRGSRATDGGFAGAVLTFGHPLPRR